MRTLNKRLLIVCCSIALTACVANHDKYYWGRYEQLLYSSFNNPGEASSEVQIEQILSDIQQAESKGKPVAPGVYAHLGYLYAAQGKLELAVSALNEEKTLFPDSAKFIDGIIERATKQQPREQL